MNFMNNTILIISLFFVFLIIQYVRYRRMSKFHFHLSGLLLIKILIRSFILVSMILVLNNLLKSPNKIKEDTSNALFILSCEDERNFKLSEDDQINISTRLPAMKFKKIELWLYNTSSQKFFVYIPSTSEKVFMHLLKIERAKEIFPLEKIVNLNSITKPSSRIEMYLTNGKLWRRSDVNQDNFNLIKLFDYENDLVSPYLVHYLLILIVLLIAFDLGFKYRILKI